MSCGNHPGATLVARCQRCDFAMCDECWSWLSESAPCCERCVAELSTGPQSRWPFGAALAVISIGIAFWGARVEEKPTLELWITVAVLGVVLGLIIGFSSPTNVEPGPNIAGREKEDAPSPEAMQHAAHPYRTRVARVARRALPLSGRATAFVLMGAFVLSGVLVPLGLRLPRWIELEIVLAVWWGVVLSLLTLLLYRGFRLVDDHRFRIGELPSLEEKRRGSGCSADIGCADASGCGEAIGAVLILIVAAVAAWLLVEVLIPVLFFAVYYFTIKAIGRVARDRHDCAGHLARSLAWGAAFATLYVAPLALLVGAVQAVLRLKAGS